MGSIAAFNTTAAGQSRTDGPPQAHAKQTCERTAAALYYMHITATGYTPPTTFDELLLFVQLSGCPVGFCQNAPEDFRGVQLSEWVFVSGSENLTDKERMRILAHEWAHELRERRYYHRRLHLYGGKGSGGRHIEEDIARAFERLF